MKTWLKKFASLKATCALLVAFLVLTFWGVLAQANAESAGLSVADATARFFDSYFLWAMGFVPLPALKSLAVVGVAQLLASMAFRMPRVRGVPGGWRNIGLYGMHVALLVLLVGGLVGSEFRQEYNGFRASLEPSKKISFYAVDDSLNTHTVDVPEGYPYFVFYKGQVDMFGVQVDLYSATYDPFKFVPYAFSILFLLSILFHYVARVRGKPSALNGKFGALHGKRGVLRNSGTAVVLLLFVGFSAALSYGTESDALIWLGTSPESPVLVGESIRPFDSFARGVLDDFCGRVTYKHRGDDGSGGTVSAVHVVEAIRHAPQFANTYNLFKVLRGDVAEALDLPAKERYVSYDALQHSRGKLEIYASRKDNLPATLEMQRLLKNVLLYEAIAKGEIPLSMPYDEQLKKNGKMKSEYVAAAEAFATKEARKIDHSRLIIETIYNKLNFTMAAFVLAFIGCVLASINSVFKRRAFDVAANVCGGMAFAVLSVAFALRCYVATRPPLSSLYEIVLLVALLLEAFEIGAFVFCKKRTFSLMIPVTLMATVLLFFAKFILEPGDLFQPVPAILNSSVFLTLHVFTIALGFAGMILSGVVAHVALFRVARCPAGTEKIQNATKLLFGTLVFGGSFTILGTLLGGVWADFAWGRFWGFDPKECGAFFVCLWAMLSLHLRASKLVSCRGFALFSCFNVIVTFLCWFGVNLLGVGLHSYGFQSGTAVWLVSFVIADSAVIAILARRRMEGITSLLSCDRNKFVR